MPLSDSDLKALQALQGSIDKARISMDSRRWWKAIPGVTIFYLVPLAVFWSAGMSLEVAARVAVFPCLTLYIGGAALSAGMAFYIRTQLDVAQAVVDETDTSGPAAAGGAQ